MATAQTKQAAPAKPAVDPSQVVLAAIAYCNHLYGGKVSDVSLEELELSEDNHFWLITLSFNVSEPPKNKNLPDFLRVPQRKLKVFKANAKTGEVVSMKMPSGG